MKPAKPSPDFPLFAHASGKWAKKIHGRIRYFGRWDDPQAALVAYERLTADLISDNVSHGLTVRDACNAFLTAKDNARSKGELSQSTFADYRRSCELVVKAFGPTALIKDLVPSNFAALRVRLAEKRGVIAVGNEITRVRVLFKYLWDARLIPAPIHFGPDFKRPSRKALRRQRREGGKKLFTSDQILRLLDESGLHQRAMILLGINCGFGNTDCALLPLAALDLDAGMVRFPRPKTEVERDCPLWPETVAALRTSLERRPEPGQAAQERVFVQYDGQPWELSAKPITKQTRQALMRADIKRGGFYWLRHTFRTVADGAKDPVAANAIMGHVDSSMAATYREEIDPARLLAVTEHVRNWLFQNGTHESKPILQTAAVGED